MITYIHIDIVVVAQRQTSVVAVQVENHVAIHVYEVVALALLEIDESLNLRTVTQSLDLTIYC